MSSSPAGYSGGGSPASPSRSSAARAAGWSRSRTAARTGRCRCTSGSFRAMASNATTTAGPTTAAASASTCRISAGSVCRTVCAPIRCARSTAWSSSFPAIRHWRRRGCPPALGASQRRDYKTRRLNREVACHYTFMHENLFDMNHQFMHRKQMGSIRASCLGRQHGEHWAEVEYSFSRTAGKSSPWASA